MTRLFRTPPKVAPVAGLLFSLAAAVLWLRSHYVWDDVPVGSRFRIVSSDGTVAFDNKPEQEAFARPFYGGGHFRMQPLSPPGTPPEQIVWGLVPPSPPKLPPAPSDIRLSISYPGLSASGLLLFLGATIVTAARRPCELTNLCPACGYDLRATPDRCPECGATPPAEPARPGGAGG